MTIQNWKRDEDGHWTYLLMDGSEVKAISHATYQGLYKGQPIATCYDLAHPQLAEQFCLGAVERAYYMEAQRNEAERLEQAAREAGLL